MRHNPWSAKFTLLFAAVALAAALVACGGGGGGGGVTFRDAAPADLANRAFAFGPGLFSDDPQDPRSADSSTLVIGSFHGDRAAFALVNDADGSVVAGSLAVGNSCTVTVSFLELAGEELRVLAPDDPDAVSVLDPCEIGSDGSLRVADDQLETFLSSPGRAPQAVLNLSIPLAAAYEVPGNLAGLALLEGRSETGTASLALYEGNVLSYSLAVEGLTQGDALTVSHIHRGDVHENGPVVITLVGGPAQASGVRPLDTIPQFDGGTSVTASAALTGAEVADLTAAGNHFYVNVHSNQVGAGVVRGQIGQEIVLASNVFLSTANEVPPVPGRTETGLAVMRGVDGAAPAMKFFLEVFDLDPTDALQVAHIHSGGPTENGPVVISLVGGPAQPPLRPLDVLPVFGGETSVRGEVPVSAQELADLVDPTRAWYVNIHSTQVGSGLVRGQLREVTFANAIQPILTPNCAVAGCHGTPLGAPMSLLAGVAYGNLVNAPSLSLSSELALRVAPGSTAQSELYRRVTSADPLIRMPVVAPLSQAQIDLIGRWISGGALED
ncbi:MAG: CHRD domain-containing protein [Thermodesulfobacteriota bacterium]